MKGLQLFGYILFFIVSFFSILVRQDLITIYVFLMAWSAVFYFMNSEKIGYDKYKLWQEYYTYIPVVLQFIAMLVLILFLAKRVLAVS